MRKLAATLLEKSAINKLSNAIFGKFIFNVHHDKMLTNLIMCPRTFDLIANSPFHHDYYELGSKTLIPRRHSEELHSKHPLHDGLYFSSPRLFCLDCFMTS